MTGIEREYMIEFGRTLVADYKYHDGVYNDGTDEYVKIIAGLERRKLAAKIEAITEMSADLLEMGYDEFSKLIHE